MNNLESLVPPLELCKKIPEGKFADSVFEWNTHGKTDGSAELQVKASDKRRYGFYFPAPTLEEIWEALENHGRVYTQRDDDGWMVMLEIAGDDEGYGYDAKIERDPDNPATAALRLWMEVE